MCFSFSQITHNDCIDKTSVNVTWMASASNGVVDMKDNVTIIYSSAVQVAKSNVKRSVL